jgi:hypothetical protein
VVWFSLQEPVVCGLVAGLRVSVLCHCDSGILARLYKGVRSELLCSAVMSVGLEEH